MTPAIASGHRDTQVEDLLTRRWARLFFPSLTDLLFISMVVWLFMLGEVAWNGLLLDGDTGYHIRTGEYILQHGAVPRIDLFSFSRPQDAWYAWEWLSDVIFGGLFDWSGLKGVVLLSALLIVGYVIVLVRHMLWRGSNAAIALAISLLAAGAASIHYHARPHIFTLFLTVVTMWLLDAGRRQRARAVWILVPLTVVWTNLHGGFLVLIAALGLQVLGIAIETFLRTDAQDWANFRRWDVQPVLNAAGLFVACSAVTLLNPYGYGLHVHLVEYLKSEWIRQAVQEFQAPLFRSQTDAQFEILLFLGVAAAVLLLRRKRVVEALWILYFAHQSLISVRHVTIFVIVAAPYIASQVTEWWVKAGEGWSRGSVAGIVYQISWDFGAGMRRTSLWTGAFILTLACTGAPIPWPRDLPAFRFPAQMISEHQELIKGHRVLTTDQWGDFLIFKYYPVQRVFMDGRSDFYGPELGRRYLGLSQGRYDWKEIIDQNRFDTVLLPSDWALNSLLKRDADWQLIKDDGKALLFWRVGGPNAHERVKNLPHGLMKKTDVADGTTYKG